MPGAPESGEAGRGILDRWRAPGERRSRAREERFGETRYLALGLDARARALEAAGIEAGYPGEMVSFVSVVGTERD